MVLASLTKKRELCAGTSAGVVSVCEAVHTFSDDRPVEPHLGTGLRQPHLPRQNALHLFDGRLRGLRGGAPVVRTENVVEALSGNVPRVPGEELGFGSLPSLSLTEDC
jgi:hypothetical protein